MKQLYHDPRVHRVLEHVHDNLQLPLPLSSLAAIVDLSEFHFLRLFKEATGLPPGQYLRQLRVATAARHLEHGTSSVTEIAALCGFSSPSHLATAFKARTGFSPSEYRRLWARRPTDTAADNARSPEETAR